MLKKRIAKQNRAKAAVCARWLLPAAASAGCLSSISPRTSASMSSRRKQEALKKQVKRPLGLTAAAMGNAETASEPIKVQRNAKDKVSEP